MRIYIFIFLDKIVDLRKKRAPVTAPFRIVAEWTGLEPATPGVTGRYSNQLNYHSAFSSTKARQRRPCFSAESIRKSGSRAGISLSSAAFKYLVGAEGFEPPTLAL